MRSLPSNEMRALLILFKEYTTHYNANSLARAMGLSAMGVHKILKRLEAQGLVSAEEIGRAKIFRINYRKAYTRSFLSFMLDKEAEESAPHARRWVVELQKLKPHAKTCVLFGSALDGKGTDVDTLLVLEQKQLAGANKRLAAIARTSAKTVHATKQTPDDLVENLRERDKVLVDALKRGIIPFGHKELVELMTRVAR